MNIRYEKTSPQDLDDLIQLRIEAMQEGLEQVGLFDPERIAERLRASFDPKNTTKVLLDETLIGFFSVLPKEDHLYLHHFYIRPGHQSMGIGSSAITRVIELSETLSLPIKLRALKVSRSNGFYQRHGFIAQSDNEWDVYYHRDF